jgi:type IV pilus assembly protein PilO
MVRILQEIIRQRRRQLLIIAALICLGLIVYFVRVTLLQDKVVNARREWSTQRSQLKQKTMLGRADQYAAGMRDITHFTERIPGQRDFARVISELFELADDNSLTVGSVTYKPEKGIAGYVEYKINVDLTGTYGGIKSFLVDVNRTPEIIIVDTIGLNKGGKLFDDEVKLRVTLAVLFGLEGK